MNNYFHYLFTLVSHRLQSNKLETKILYYMKIFFSLNQT